MRRKKGEADRGTEAEGDSEVRWRGSQDGKLEEGMSTRQRDIRTKR